MVPGAVQAWRSRERRVPDPCTVCGRRSLNQSLCTLMPEAVVLCVEIRRPRRLVVLVQ